MNRPLGPQAGLLLSEGGVPGQAQRPVQGGRVVAAVVGVAAGRGVGESAGGRQVEAAHLGGVHAQLTRQQVHDPLDEEYALRASGAAVGRLGRAVGVGRLDLQVRLGYVVGAHADHGRGDGQVYLGGFGIGADVRHMTQPHRRHPAFAGGGELQVRGFSPGVAQPDELLGAAGCPLHRRLDLQGGGGQQDVLGVAVGLGSEPPAHVRGHHAHLFLGQAQDFHQVGPQIVRGLGAGPEGKAGLLGVPVGQARPGLHGGRVNSLVHYPLPHYHAGFFESLRHVGGAAPPLQCKVRAIVVHLGSAGAQRLLRVHRGG